MVIVSKKRVTEPQKCPATKQTVTISREIVMHPGMPPAEASKTCSNVEKCLSEHKTIDNIAGCLLRK